MATSPLRMFHSAGPNIHATPRTALAHALTSRPVPPLPFQPTPPHPILPRAFPSRPVPSVFHLFSIFFRVDIRYSLPWYIRFVYHPFILAILHFEIE
mmetsp:Transcript_607/g.1025  ORF Transcript_607/g.1025 Transcript_607/m.1025 type:complete len:97 (+) Transcript_607:1515-1805(+)